ncbi:hypothetical protein J8I26_04330 [Herbaspirillum sp. LeCh32-8]|uniref:hypothetical protein n=1 Tax=Herbaspirillum sp. LeCh32-8 TaxID=2821356 RepID=UPI001AE8D137|nr:hypothetical protein [Herbaspirillum sp. LeCh32-8]MBP0597318.1 hypothetical protein [Herbaspirillum sp. LeCh32-8]
MPFNIVNNFLNRLEDHVGVSRSQDRFDRSSRTSDDGDRRHSAPGFSRIARRVEEFAGNRGQDKLAQILNAYSPQRGVDNFWSAIGHEMGWNFEHPAPVHDDPAAAGRRPSSTSGASPPATPGSTPAPQFQAPPTDPLGSHLHRHFADLFQGVPRNVARFLERRPQQITEELEDFQVRQRHQREHGGPPPRVPDVIPSHLRSLVAQLDPNDPEYGQKLFGIVTAGTEFEQRARDQAAQNIGAAPRPRPGHEHGVSGGAWDPELAPNGDVLFQETESTHGPVVYERPPLQPPSSPPAAYRRPTVESDNDADMPPPRPPRLL